MGKTKKQGIPRVNSENKMIIGEGDAAIIWQYSTKARWFADSLDIAKAFVNDYMRDSKDFAIARTNYFPDDSYDDIVDWSPYTQKRVLTHEEYESIQMCNVMKDLRVNYLRTLRHYMDLKLIDSEEELLLDAVKIIYDRWMDVVKCDEEVYSMVVDLDYDGVLCEDAIDDMLLSIDPYLSSDVLNVDYIESSAIAGGTGCKSKANKFYRSEF